MVDATLKNGKKLKFKYSCLVKNAKNNMTPIKNLSEVYFGLTKQQFCMECLKELGKMYSMRIEPKDLYSPTYKMFSNKIMGTHLQKEKKEDDLFVSFNFMKVGWKLIRVDSNTELRDFDLVLNEYAELGDKIKLAIDRKNDKRRLRIGYDEKKRLK